GGRDRTAARAPSIQPAAALVAACDCEARAWQGAPRAGALPHHHRPNERPPRRTSIPVVLPVAPSRPSRRGRIEPPGPLECVACSRSASYVVSVDRGAVWECTTTGRLAVRPRAV